MELNFIKQLTFAIRISSNPYITSLMLIFFLKNNMSLFFKGFFFLCENVGISERQLHESLWSEFRGTMVKVWRYFFISILSIGPISLSKPETPRIS